jgi:Domain of unknown function (DUF4350)
LNERFVTLVLALGALALFYLLFVPKPVPAEQSQALPTSRESGPDGYQAAWRWLQSEGIPVRALHERYDRLNSRAAPFRATGNVLLTTLPHKLPPRSDEATQLDAWVERGNTLVVMAALDDTPLWTLGDSTLEKAAGRLTRLKFSVIDAKPSPQERRAPRMDWGALAQPKDSVIVPRGAHPLLEGVHSVRVVSELPASRWRASPMDRATVLQIGEIAGNGDPAIWLRRQGEGAVMTFAVASIFSNRLIGQGDNAKLLSNVIAWSLRSGGAVIFDDAHQGDVSYYDAKAFFRDPRLHRSLGWIVLLWFVFVLGVQRLRARPRDWNPIDVTAFVAMSGEFFASALTPAAAGSRLFENFFNSIRRRLNLGQDGRPLWDWLSVQAAVSGGELSELRRLHDRVQAGRSVDLIRLQNLLSQLQGNLI